MFQVVLEVHVILEVVALEMSMGVCQSASV